MRMLDHVVEAVTKAATSTLNPDPAGAPEALRAKAGLLVAEEFRGTRRGCLYVMRPDFTPIVTVDFDFTAVDTGTIRIGEQPSVFVDYEDPAAAMGEVLAEIAALCAKAVQR